jgi:hydroxyisourate hydrolase
MNGRLSTHVLDISKGSPAAGVTIQLWRVETDNRRFLKEAVTNQDGRTDGPLLAGDDLEAGIYELVFKVETYFGGSPFLTEVPVRFRVVNPAENYHIPLLVSPWSYSTYRGS